MEAVCCNTLSRVPHYKNMAKILLVNVFLTHIILQCDLNKVIIWSILAIRQEFTTTCDTEKMEGNMRNCISLINMNRCLYVLQELCNHSNHSKWIFQASKLQNRLHFTGWQLLQTGQDGNACWLENICFSLCWLLLTCDFFHSFLCLFVR